MSTSTTYPVHVDAQLDPGLSRGLWVVKWLLAIPHYFVLFFLWMAFAVLSVVAFFAILFTGRYPRAIFDFNVGVLRWSWRVSYYTYGALGTDRYPPFTLAEVPDYPAHLEVDYPSELSRGLVLVKWWLLALPHYLVLGLFLGGGLVIAGRIDERESWVWNTGLIGLLVLIAAFALLFTGRYPRALYDLVLGLNRWVLRVAAYAALMTDEYPPFRLDQGGHEPGPDGGVEFSTGPAGDAVQLEPPTGGTTTHPAAEPPRNRGRQGGWTTGRVVVVALGSLGALFSFGLLGSAGLLGIAQVARDGDGFLMSPDEHLETSTYALTSESVELDFTGVPSSLPDELIGNVKLTVDGAGGTPVFVGILPTRDAESYLAGVEHSVLVDGGTFTSPAYRNHEGGAPTSPPAQLPDWAASTSGTGEQQLVWEPTDGDWTVVVMNADGSRGIDVRAAAGAEVPVLGWGIAVMLVLGGTGLLLSGLLIFLAVRGATRDGSRPTGPVPQPEPVA